MAKTSKKTSRFSLNNKTAIIGLSGILIGVLGTVLITEGFAAPKGGGSAKYTGTINSVKMISDANSDGQPNVNDTISFNVTSNYDANAAGPWIDLVCTQNGNFAYSQSAGFGPAYPWPADYTLASAYWKTGGADCNATLYYADARGRHHNMATYSFTVNP